MHKMLHLAVSPLTKTINKEILPHMLAGMPLIFCLKLVKSAYYYSIAALSVISTIQPIVLYLFGCIPPCSVLGLSGRPDLVTLRLQLLLLPLSVAGNTAGVRFFLFFLVGSAAITGSSAFSSFGPSSSNNSLGSSATSASSSLMMLT